MKLSVIPTTVRTTCPYCGVGCGVLARPDGRGGAITTGDPDHPANSGRLCSKGFALEETLGLNGRLLHPMLRRADSSYAKVDWDTALAAVADGFRKIIDRDGPGVNLEEARYETPYAVDAPADREQKAKLGALSPDDVTATELAGEAITAKLTEAPGNGAKIGGLKVTTESAWFAARPSGTEDVYKIYAESFRGPDHLAEVQEAARDVVSAALG